MRDLEGKQELVKVRLDPWRKKTVHTNLSEVEINDGCVKLTVDMTDNKTWVMNIGRTVKTADLSIVKGKRSILSGREKDVINLLGNMG